MKTIPIPLTTGLVERDTCALKSSIDLTVIDINAVAPTFIVLVCGSTRIRKSPIT